MKSESCRVQCVIKISYSLDDEDPKSQENFMSAFDGIVEHYSQLDGCEVEIIKVKVGDDYSPTE